MTSDPKNMGVDTSTRLFGCLLLEILRKIVIWQWPPLICILMGFYKNAQGCQSGINRNIHSDGLVITKMQKNIVRTLMHAFLANTRTSTKFWSPHWKTNQVLRGSAGSLSDCCSWPRWASRRVILFLPLPSKVNEVMFSLLSVCLFVCKISEKVVEKSKSSWT